MNKLYRVTSTAALGSIALMVTGLAVLIGTGGFGA